MAFFQFDAWIEDLADKAQKNSKKKWDEIEKIAEYNQQKMLWAFQKNQVSETHFYPTTGYGYGDRGREVLDQIFADIFGSEDALVRHFFISGTHALCVTLFGLLKTGDTLLAVTGKPYDTLDDVIGISGEGMGSLKEYNIGYQQVDMKNGKVDYAGIKEKLDETTKVVFIQRSKGYDSVRPTLSCEEIGEICAFVKKLRPDCYCVVDNCYGEFVEKTEPTQHGADVVVGSLIKNAGGGLAQSGAYVAGSKKAIELISYRLTAPGIGKECGASLGQNRYMYQGIFMAPHVVGQSLKTAVFCAAVYQELGFFVSPGPLEKRYDIIQAIRFEDPQKLIAFCQGIQRGAPVDSYVDPQPWDMPGYSHQVIMAAGAFVQGASIELSADGPMREPYVAYMQGGLTFESGKTGILLSVQRMREQGLL
jgi:cystathionine beta-lyase family protein involved in aluminum resistance